MATIDEENAKNIRQKLRISITIWLGSGQNPLSFQTKDIVSCVVSLRADLSDVAPTLPESEIELQIYSADDISNKVADADLGAEVSYSAGYTGNMSQTRYFYTDEPIRWENGILYVHAVDQVHKLDGTLSPIYLGQQWNENVYNQSYYGGFGYLYSVFWDILDGEATRSPVNNSINLRHMITRPFAMMSPSLVQIVDGHYSQRPEGGAVNSIIESSTRREMIAKLMNLCHQEFPEGFLNENSPFGNAFWLTYVDAGRPRISVEKPTSKYTIYEEDCANIVKKKERKVSEYRFKVRDVVHVNAENIQGMDFVNATIFKQKGMALEYSGFVDSCAVGIRIENNPEYAGVQNIWEIDWKRDWPEKARPYGSDAWTNHYDQRANYYYGQWLLDPNLVDSDWLIGKYSFYDLAAVWNTPNHYGDTPAQSWADWVSAGGVTATDTETSATSRGTYFVTTNEQEYIIDNGNTGIVVAPEDYIWNGHIKAKSWYSDDEIRVLPDYGLESIAKRPREFGSFTWKGDPRMQPRDVFTLVGREYVLANEDDFELTDENGNTIESSPSYDCTVETITLTHEKGGMIAEITYRKGII